MYLYCVCGAYGSVYFGTLPILVCFFVHGASFFLNITLYTLNAARCCVRIKHIHIQICMHKHTAPKRDQNHQIAVQCKFLCIVGCVRLNVTLDCMCVLVLSFPFSHHRYSYLNWDKFFLFRNRRNNQHTKSRINLYLYKQSLFLPHFY